MLSHISPGEVEDAKLPRVVLRKVVGHDAVDAKAICYYSEDRESTVLELNLAVMLKLMFGNNLDMIVLSLVVVIMLPGPQTLLARHRVMTQLNGI